MPRPSQDNLAKLIRILSDGKFHSGESLGKMLGMTRAGVWKTIQQLSDWDITINAKSNRGYQIPEGLELLDPSEISRYIEPANKHHPIEIFDSLPSTSEYLIKTDAVKADKVRICLAERQTAGRGRRGRSWFSPFARNIYCSIAWRFEKDISQLGCLSLAVGVAAIKALEHYGMQETIAIKWPNDIYWQKHKLAGILIEVNGETHSHCNVVIGIGINVNCGNGFKEHINQPWIDIASITKAKPARNRLTGLLINQLMKTVAEFEHKGFEPFKAAWQAYDCTLNQTVEIITPLHIVKGIGHGINEEGCFLLEDSQGLMHTFSSGEVSLRC